MLTPIRSAEIDARLRAHLDPNERVLWQGRPKQGSFFGPGIVTSGVGLILIGLLLALGLIDGLLPANTRFALAATSAVAGLIILGTGWRRRATLWAYGVTDKRLLSVLGDKLIRSVTPEQLDRLTLNVRDDTVYWMRLQSNQSAAFDTRQWRGPDGQFVGFHGQSDAHAIKAMIEAWRVAMSHRASDEARSFAQGVRVGAPYGAMIDIKASAPTDGVRRIRHAATGLTMDMPSDWQVQVSTRTERPLRLFGMTVLPRLVHESDKMPYEPDAAWNTLHVRAAPEAGLSLILHDTPLKISLDSVLNDPWSRATGTTILRPEPALGIGPFTGFGVVRALPKGAQIRSNPALSAPAMTHQVWLKGGGIFLEIEGYALEGQSDIQNAIEAMIASLSLRG